MRKGVFAVAMTMLVLVPLPGFAAGGLPLTSKLTLFFLVYLLGLLLTVLVLLAIAKRGKNIDTNDRPR